MFTKNCYNVCALTSSISVVVLLEGSNFTPLLSIETFPARRFPCALPAAAASCLSSPSALPASLLTLREPEEAEDAMATSAKIMTAMNDFILHVPVAEGGAARQNVSASALKGLVLAKEKGYVIFFFFGKEIM